MRDSSSSLGGVDGGLRWHLASGTATYRLHNLLPTTRSSSTLVFRQWDDDLQATPSSHRQARDREIPLDLVVHFLITSFYRQSLDSVGSHVVGLQNKALQIIQAKQSSPAPARMPFTHIIFTRYRETVFRSST